MQRIPTLDGWRGIAILMVFSCHYLGRLWWVSQWGWAGVDLFFVLSGFLITGILYDARDGEHRFRNFYIRRTLRIFPLYYGVLLMFVLLYPLLHWQLHEAYALAPVYLNNVQRFLFLHEFAAHPGGNIEFLRSVNHPRVWLSVGHFWTLAVEEQFYLVWPLVVFTVRDRRKLMNICSAVFWLCPLLRFAAVLTVPPLYINALLLHRFTPFRMDTLMAGGYAALLLRGDEPERTYASARRCLWLLCPVVVLFQAASMLRPGGVYTSPSPDNPLMSIFGFSMLAALFTCVIVLSLRPGTLSHRVGKLRPLRWLGIISYGFYVFHDIPSPIFHALIPKLSAYTPFAPELVACLAFTMTTGLAYLSFRYIESPFLRMKERWTVASSASLRFAKEVDRCLNHRIEGAVHESAKVPAV